MTGDGEARLLHTILFEAASRWPEKVAVYDVEDAWTYADLDLASRRYAGALTAAGVGVGDRVLIRARAECWVLAALHACSRVGAVAVPLSPDLRPAQWEQITQDAEPSAVWTEPPRGSVPAATEPEPADPDAPALFLYTSGSTTRPKAVVCPHRQVLFAAEAIAGRLEYRRDDVILCRLPLSFDYGLYQSLMAALVGATVVLRGPGGSDSGLLATIRQHEVTVVPVVPPLATLLARLGRRGAVSTVRLITNTGQELTQAQLRDLRRTFPDAVVRLMYGITECKRVTIAEPDADLIRPGSVGVPLPGTRVRVVDPTGRSVPTGTEGQIVVSGPHLMSGYWRAPELTARTYRWDSHTGERALYTGDFGSLGENGDLFFHGRRDDLFKQRGVRTSVAEIEAATLQIDQVRDAAVVPPRGDEGAVLFAVSSLEAVEVLLRLRDRLEAAKVPAICRLLPELPVGTTGKTDRASLRALVEAEREETGRA
ncbi:class I adenylate-forming enzyme family protein [Streptomyces sp. NPDC005438]|uniref:class I adenylate-forming enzyme family protein n=1 Tax=Streptomyces sp. NPDC005438 TaxID=3156880 RepID=UPI0033B935CA